MHSCDVVFFFNDTATTEIYTLSLHDALPICGDLKVESLTDFPEDRFAEDASVWLDGVERTVEYARSQKGAFYLKLSGIDDTTDAEVDRKSTRLNSSHANISYAVFCLKKKNKT